MALIVCKHCGKQMSDRADVCPHCGEISEAKEIELQHKKKRRKILLILLTIIGAILSIGFLESAIEILVEGYHHMENVVLVAILFVIVIRCCIILSKSYNKTIKRCAVAFCACYLVIISIVTIPYCIYYYKYKTKHIVETLQNKKLVFDKLTVLVEGNDIILQYDNRKKCYKIDGVKHGKIRINDNKVSVDDMLELFGDDFDDYFKVKVNLAHYSDYSDSYRGLELRKGHYKGYNNFHLSYFRGNFTDMLVTGVSLHLYREDAIIE